jgi:hypothetical protein
LSEDTLKVPEHVVLEEFVVTVVVSIASENVTVMLSVIATELWLSAVVETEDTVGAVVSVVTVVTVKDVIVREPLKVVSDLLVEIVLETVIVQSAYVPTLKVFKVMVLLPEIAEVVLEEHESP